MVRTKAQGIISLKNQPCTRLMRLGRSLFRHRSLGSVCWDFGDSLPRGQLSEWSYTSQIWKVLWNGIWTGRETVARIDGGTFIVSTQTPWERFVAAASAPFVVLHELHHVYPRISMVSNWKRSTLLSFPILATPLTLFLFVLNCLAVDPASSSRVLVASISASLLLSALTFWTGAVADEMLEKLRSKGLPLIEVSVNFLFKGDEH